MSEFKEFQGKNLDEAITNACDHFNLNRDKLEIEIVSGGSTGVFGLVGKKNAKVKARPRFVEKQSYEEDSGRKQQKKPQQPKKAEYRAEAPKGKPARQEKSSEQETPAVKPESSPAVKPEGEMQVKQEAETPAVSEQREEAPAPVREEKAQEEPQSAPAAEAPEGDDVKEEVTSEADESRRDEPAYAPERRNVMEGDPEEIAAAVKEALELMIEPIVQDKPKLEIEVGEDRVNVLVDDEENSGLIIGREGQTLSALQYLCNRMVSKKLQTSVRVQIDTGDYRERQDEKLRQLAWHLADKALNTGRVQSTKPLSSYHRRVVHMALQEDKNINTRSKGDGPMKRVLILPKRGRGGKPSGGYNRDRGSNYGGRQNKRFDNKRGPQDNRGNQSNRANQSVDEDNFNNEFAPGGYHSENSYAAYDPNAVSNLYSGEKGQQGNKYNNERNQGERYNRNNRNDRNKRNARGGQGRYNNRKENYGNKRTPQDNRRNDRQGNSSDGFDNNFADRYSGRY